MLAFCLLPFWLFLIVVKDTLVSGRPDRALTAAVVEFFKDSARAGNFSPWADLKPLSVGWFSAMVGSCPNRQFERLNLVILRQNNADNTRPQQDALFRRIYLETLL